MMLSFLDTHTRFFVWLLLLLAGGHVAAQQGFTVSMEVKDDVTKHRWENLSASVYELQEDGSTKAASNVHKDYYSGVLTLVFASKPLPGKYTVSIMPMKQVAGADDPIEYRYEWPTVKIVVPPDAADSFKMPTVYLKRKKRSKELDEVTVTASKIMFYNKGDTLVYNADAFVLSEGTMLDGLLAQMPGVELSPSGVITVRGRRARELLINGKNLFNGRNELMLENLAAYTIKDVQFYDKLGHRSELMGERSGDERYVMDVKLKREYSHGGAANADAGYGTANRYLAKLFGMWYSDNVGMTGYANVNNLSSDKKPSEKDNIWQASDMASGRFKNAATGLSYNAMGSDDRWEMRGAADVTYRNYDNPTEMVRENFLVTQGNTYDYSWSRQNRTNLDVVTDHNFFAKLGSRAFLRVKPEFKFTKSDNASGRLKGSLYRSIDNPEQSTFEDILSADDTLRRYLISRVVDAETRHGDNLSGAVRIDSDIKLKSTGRKSMLGLRLYGNYTSDNYKAEHSYDVLYGNTSLPGQNISYCDNRRPQYSVKAYGGVDFLQYFYYHKLRLPISYDFTYVQNHKESGVSDCDGSMASLPDYSFESLQRELVHSVDIRLEPGNDFYVFGYSHLLNVNLQAKFDFANRSFSYIRGQAESNYKCFEFLPEIWFRAHLKPLDGLGWKYSVNARYEVLKKDLDRMVAQPVTDPLVSFLGNDSLRNASSTNFWIKADYGGRGMVTHSVSLSALYVANPVTSSYQYEYATGKRVFKSENGKFRLNLAATYRLFTPLGARREFNISSDTRAGYTRSLEPFRASTMLRVEENLKVSWQRGVYRVSAFADGLFRAYRYPQGYDNFNAFETRYGFEAVFNLPKRWSLSTDMCCYSRCGYEDKRLNTTDIVWNARVSKSILKGALMFAIDAYDMLQQISNVTYSADSQGRTEIVSHGIPAYVLFHVQYRFNRQPK